MVDGFHGMLLLSAKYQDVLFAGKRPCEKPFGMPLDGHVIPSIVEHHLMFAEDMSRLRHFRPKVLPGRFFGYALCAGKET